MTLDDLKELAEGKSPAELVFEGECHDCKKEILVPVILREDDRVEMFGGAPYRVTMGDTGEKKIFLKCKECFKKNPTMTDYQHTEIYSRIVGYLRPLSQWNKGKKVEFELRKDFEIGGVKKG